MSATSVGQIGLDLVVNQNQFNKQMVGVQSLAKKTGKMLVAAFGVKQLVNYSKQCIELASDLQEVQNVANVAFPNMTAQMNDFAKSAVASFGLSETMAKKYSSLYGTMAKQFGFTEKAAYEMGTTLTGLAGDVASFYNMSQDEAYTKLKSVFSGETETLKEIGVVMTQSALDAYALANGFGKTTKSMSEAEKVALRYAYVQSQLSAATGDFLRTSDSWANQTRLLKLNLQQLGTVIGGSFINAFKPLISTLNTVINKFTAFAQAVSDSLGKIFGWEHEDTGGGVVSDLENGAGSANDIASGIGNAADSAKKLKQQLRGIDELNVISSSENLGNSIVPDIASSANGNQWVQTEGFVDSFKSEIALIKKLFQDIKIGDWFAVGEDVSDLVSGIFDFFSRAIEKVDWYTLGNNIGLFLEGINWTDVLSSVGNLIWEAINAAIELWKGSFDAAPIETTIITAIGLLSWSGLGSALLKGMKNSLITSLGGTPGSGFGSIIVNLIKNAISNPAVGQMLINSPGFAVFGDYLMTALDDALSKILPEGLKNSLSNIFAGVAIGAVGGSWIPGIGTLAGAIVGGIFAALEEIKIDGTSILSKIFDWSVTFGEFDKAGEFFKQVAKDFENKDWASIGINILKGIGEGLLGVVLFIGEPIKNLFEFIEEEICKVFGINSPAKKMIPYGRYIFLGIVEGFSNNFDKMREKIKTFRNNIENWWDKNKPKLSTIETKIKLPRLKVTWDTKGWAAEALQKLGLKGFPNFSVSYYEQGGFPEDGWFRAKHGEIMGRFDNGKSVVANNNQITEGISSAVYRGNQEGNALIRQQISLLQRQNELLLGILEKESGISSDDIFNSVRKSADSYTKRTGNPAFV